MRVLFELSTAAIFRGAEACLRPNTMLHTPAGAGLSVFLYSAAIDLTLIMAFFTGGSVTMMMLISASTSR